MIWCVPAFQHLSALPIRPICHSRRSDVWNIPHAFRIRAARKARIWFDGPEQVSGGMTFGAMRHRFGKILTAIPDVTAVRLRNDRCPIKKQDFPKADDSPETKKQV